LKSLPAILQKLSRQDDVQSQAIPSFVLAPSTPAEGLLSLLANAHSTNVLTDITSNLREIVALVSTEDGQRQLTSYLEETDVHRIIDFMEEEWIVE
jgi:hypothetical protein